MLLEEDPNATLAGVVSVVRGGSGADPAGGEGLAHMVEHLTYRAVDGATGAAPALTRWDRLIQLATAEMNGHTTPDCVFFYEFAAPHQLRGLLALAAARLGDPLAGVDERAFDLERQIIGSEHLVRADPRAGQWAVNALFPQVFPAQHPYARPTGGTEESRRHFTFADARAYAARTFRPQRMTVLVSRRRARSRSRGSRRCCRRRLTSERDADAARRAGCDASAPAPATPAPPAATAATPIAVERKPSPLSVPELWLAWTLPGGFGDLGPTEEVLGHWVDSDVRSDQFAKEEPQIRHAGAWVQAGRIGERAVRARDRGRRGGRPSRGAGAGGARLQPVGARARRAAELRGTAPRVRDRAHSRRARAARARGEAGAGHRAGRPRAARVRRAVVGRGGEERGGRRVRLPAPDAERAHATFFAPHVALERQRWSARRDRGRAQRGCGIVRHRA